MSYELKTIQPGNIVDVFKYNTYKELLDDLEAVEQLPSITVDHIKKDGLLIDIENCFMDVYVDEERE